MFEKYFNNKFLILYFIPFILGSLSILAFNPFNITILNLLIFPTFFYLTIYINKKSRSTYRKNLTKRIYLYLDYFLG